MDYPCGKFGDCSFSRFGSIVRTNKHTDADERFTPATLIGVSNKQIYTPWTIKTCHFVFDYNSGVSLSIFTIFVPVERGRNALQFTYLMTWWRHNSVRVHVTKFYFIQLVLKIKYVEFEDRLKFLLKNLWKCESFSARRLIKEFST